MLLPVALSVAAAYGAHLLYTAVVFRWRGIGPGPARASRNPRARKSEAGRQAAAEWLARAGLADVKPGQFGAVMVMLFVVGSSFTFALFGAVAAALCGGALAALAPVAAHRSRAERRQAQAREAWPRLIEEIRLLTGSVGRSIPQALLDVGRHGPVELRPAFRAAEREWLISTDFRRTVAVLKDQLADPTADVIGETLLVAYEVGGSELSHKLAALAEDRTEDLQNRRDALAQQSGVRFARRFVLIVPLGMAVAGLTIGSGRAAYQTGLGQLAVLVAVVALAACWIWAGRLLRLPEEGRVFGA
jgi:tight adherence protein B